MKKISSVFELINGYKIPSIGFGTWQIPEGDTCIEAVKEALKVGYMHIDTAAVYGNEKSVGRGIKESKINRSEIFITSKVWNNERGYEKTLKAFDRTLADLDIDYLDLYLIHWPASKSQFENWQELNSQTWRALIDLYKSQKVRSIGVSNFLPSHLDALMNAEIKPMVNQIEFHPGFMQKETVEFCKSNNILIEAWSPLGSGNLLNNEHLIKIASKYDKSVAQLCIRWCLQNETLPLVKSVNPSRIRENIDVFDFEIDNEDMNTLNNITNCYDSGLYPDSVCF